MKSCEKTKMKKQRQFQREDIKNAPGEMENLTEIPLDRNVNCNQNILGEETFYGSRSLQ